ncbi:MAG: hypothetical protein ACXU8A_11230, partial [Burkholderiaceae bacterium]
MKTGICMLMNMLSAAFFGMALMPYAIADSEISGLASVQEDGSIKMSGYLVHLYGIYIPPTEQTCYVFIRPAPCGTRSSLA